MARNIFSENMTVRACSWPLTHSSFEVKSVMSIHTKRSLVVVFGTELSGAAGIFLFHIKLICVAFCPVFHYQSFAAVCILKRILQMKPTLCTIFSVYFFNFIYNLYMFRTSPSPSSGGITVFMRHVVFCYSVQLAVWCVGPASYTE